MEPQSPQFSAVRPEFGEPESSTEAINQVNAMHEYANTLHNHIDALNSNINGLHDTAERTSLNNKNKALDFDHLVNSYSAAHTQGIRQKLHNFLSSTYQLHNDTTQNHDDRKAKLFQLAKIHLGANFSSPSPLADPQVDFDNDKWELPSFEKVSNSISKTPKETSTYSSTTPKRLQLAKPQRLHLDKPETYLQATKQIDTLNSHIEDLHSHIATLNGHMQELKNYSSNPGEPVMGVEQAAKSRAIGITQDFQKKLTAFIHRQILWHDPGQDRLGVDEKKEIFQNYANRYFGANIEDNPGNPPNITFD